MNHKNNLDLNEIYQQKDTLFHWFKMYHTLENILRIDLNNKVFSENYFKKIGRFNEKGLIWIHYLTDPLQFNTDFNNFPFEKFDLNTKNSHNLSNSKMIEDMPFEYIKNNDLHIRSINTAIMNCMMKIQLKEFLNLLLKQIYPSFFHLISFNG